ncbi:unnamed protein product [Miscanthus lutarioriparius]|uniref:Uncharacterized protein n=1 Tax=Miscanthus lutarioriparius TaxID=422564 RepID=A0A811P2I3_9POAL|nr:unnamed protein product [Miscanthus lutarioriparius]
MQLFAYIAISSLIRQSLKKLGVLLCTQGYVNWKKAKDTLSNHSVCKTHVEARLKCDDFMNQRTNVGRKLVEVSTEEEKRYEIRLTSSLDVARFLILQGDAFYGHDETCSSLNKGNYREMVEWYKDKVEVVKEAYEKGSKNCHMLSHHIQKDLTKACAEEVTTVIMDEIRGRKFSVLIDESRDVSIKEQMAVILSVDIVDLFNYVPLIVNNVVAFCMRKDALLAKHHDVLLEKIEDGEIMSGRGLNQESILARPGDTRWGSHLKTLLHILVMWGAIIDVLEIVKKDSIKPTCNGGALGLIGKMESFDFVLILHLMIELLSMTDILSRALQRKDQDIVEALHLITNMKDGLQDMRNNGWEPLLRKVKTFCEKNEFEVLDMNKEINVRGTSRHRNQKFRVIGMHGLFNPWNYFSNFDVDKLIRLAEIYAEDFDIGNLTILPNQLREFVNRARTPDFLRCTELGKVAEIMVKNNMHTSYKLVYRLIKLTLILPVATVLVERIFSAMSIIKTDLRSKMGDEWLNDLMICYNENEIFRKIDNEKIIKTVSRDEKTPYVIA